MGKDDIICLAGWSGIGEPGLAGVGYDQAIEVSGVRLQCHVDRQKGWWKATGVVIDEFEI